MFVLQSTYDRLKRQYRELDSSNDALLSNWNALVELINSKGGASFLHSTPKSSQFSQEDIRRLIQLCHPDKHNGKPMAAEMTQKLLSLKEYP